jgi:hypothetical protein
MAEPTDVVDSEDALESFWDSIDDEGNLPDTSDVDDLADEGNLPDTSDVDDLADDESEEPDTSDVDDLADDESEEPETEGEEEPEPEAVDYKSELLKTKNEIKTMAGRLRAAEERAKAAIPAPVPEQAAQAPSEEDEFLKKFRGEYQDDVVKAIDIIASKKATEIANQILSTRVVPVEQQAAQLAEQSHFAAIEAVHPDVVELDQSDEFNAWIEARPAHLRGAYQFVRERGSASEVISMLNEYKQTMKPAPKPQSKVREATPAVKRKRGTTAVAPQNRKQSEEEIWAEIPEDL